MPINLQNLRSTFHVSQTPPGWVVQGYGEDTYSGEQVTVEGALSVGAVLAAFTILMEDTASLPLMVYRRLTRGKERDVNSPYYLLLHDAPNPEHTSMVYREFVMGHLLGWGNHYSQKIWDRKGILRELWPLRPDRMKVARVNGERRYTYTLESGQTRIFRQEEIWHIPAFGFDGLIGYSRIALARHAIGLSIAAEKYGSHFFKNGAAPGIAIKHPGKLGDTAFNNLKESWDEQHKGVENSHKPAILEEGMSIEKLGIPPDDAQFIETRKFQLGEIARMFRVPGHLIGDLDRSTSWGSGIEQQELGYLSHTLRPWLKRIEQGAMKDLLLTSEKKDTIIEHLVEDFLRTDISARMTAYVQAINNGIMTRNEARERENLNPIEGLDKVLMPLNMTTVEDGEEPNPQGVVDDEDAADTNENEMQTLSLSLTPLLREAAERMARREKNEISDAAKRYKNDPQKISAWLETFYKTIHPEYMRAVLQPYVESGILTEEQVTTVITEYCKGTEPQAARLFETIELSYEANHER